MNGVFSFTVDTTLDHGTGENNCAIMVRNEQDLERNIIKVYLVLVSIILMHIYINFTRLSTALHLQGSNGTPLAHLINIYNTNHEENLHQ